MSESDVSSSEMSDTALHKLVSRLVEAGEEEGKTQSPGRVAGASVSLGSSGDEDERLLGKATGPPIWPSSTPDQPSPIQPRRSPRPDGLDREAELLAGANGSDCSSADEGRAGASLAMTTSEVDKPEVEAEADSCGYEGEGNEKLATTSRRGLGISRPGCQTDQDGAEEADDEGYGEEATKPHEHLKPFGTTAKFEEKPWLWEALNSSLREHGFREVSLKQTADPTSPVVPDPASVANALRDVMLKHGERGKAEMDGLRAEVTRLGDDLREKENTILKYRLGPDWTPDLDRSARDTPASGEIRDLRARLAESERSVVIMTQRERRALERCASVEHQCAEIQAKAEETQEALVNAQLELRSRPSLRSWRSSQRRLRDLEAKLTQATSEAEEALGVAELRRWVDTAELIRRDKENHRLKLDRLDELPTTVLAQVVQDSCRLLALQDISLLSSSISKLIKAVQMLPRLERFVNSVCSFVFAHSPNVVSAPSGGNERTMEGVLPLLQEWLTRAQAPVKLKNFEQELRRVLETRAGESQGESAGQLLKSDRAVLSAVKHLVEFERTSLREAHQIEEADRNVNDDPSPFNRVVRHFQLLFGVTTMGGCLPKLNEVYQFSSEAKTFLRNCADLLDMSNHSDTAIMRRLETMLEDSVDVESDVCLRVSHGARSWKGSR
eukprot:g18377.t1